MNETTTLSWDLHVHPGRTAEGRWGDGGQLRRAAQRAGVAGFVWKSHRGTGTHTDCQKLPHSLPYALPSITLNGDVRAVHLGRAVDLGVRWIWRHRVSLMARSVGIYHCRTGGGKCERS